MTKPKAEKNTHDQFGLRWISDPFAQPVVYPSLPRIPCLKEAKESKARREISTKWDQTFHFGRFSSAPTLLLGYHLSPGFLDQAGSYPTGRDRVTGLEWRRIQHQYGGVMCRQHYTVATKLVPNDAFFVFLSELVRVEVSNSLASINKYNNKLNTQCVPGKPDARLNCNGTFAEVDEAFYPIEIPDMLNNLHLLCKGKIPKTVKQWENVIDRCLPTSVLEEPVGLRRFWANSSYLSLWAVTENSD